MSSCEWNTREHACCASWDFHATVAKGKEEALDPSQQTGFKQPGFWITMVGFRIPLAGIPDSKAVDSGFHRPKLPGFRIPDYLTWGDMYILPSKQEREILFEATRTCVWLKIDVCSMRVRFATQQRDTSGLINHQVKYFAKANSVFTIFLRRRHGRFIV